MPAQLAGDLGVNEIIRLLGLRPHAHGGHHGETFRSPSAQGVRPALSTGWLLLQAGELVSWHHLDSERVWMWHAGGPLALSRCNPDGRGASALTLGPGLRVGQVPQAVVSAGQWQTAETLGAWTLVSCVLAPAWEEAGTVFAPTGWRPGM